MMPETNYCCDESLSMGEAQTGTAPRSDVWLLLEYPAPWGAKAFDDSTLPAEVKDRLAGWLAGIPNSRLQFIKREQTGDRRAFYVVLAQQGALYRFELADYDSLLTLDIPALAGGAANFEADRSDEKLFLVCTNAKRDVCCALHGLPLYQQMRATGGAAVWQSSHIGGHRFAGTLVCLPHGLYYGRVTDGAAIIRAYQAGEFETTNCRGRCTLAPAAQSAEIYLRQELGVQGLDAVRVLDVEQADDRWTVRLAVDTAEYLVQVQAEAVMVRESTGDAERKRVLQPVATACNPAL
mgnify:CR=1 FL=1